MVERVGSAGRRGVLTALALAAMCALAWAGPEQVAPPKVTGQQWSMVVIPDAQAYTQDYGKGNYMYDGRLDKQTQWIADNAKGLNIRFVSEVGDSVQHLGGVEGEWKLAARAFNLLHEGHDPERAALVPYGIAIGNHDYDKQGTPELMSATFEKYLGPGRFRDGAGNIKAAFKDWYRGDDKGWKYVVDGKETATGVGRNSWQTFSAGGTEYLHLTLELGVTDEAIAWAGTVMKANPGKPTIVTTHAFVDPNGRPLPPKGLFSPSSGAALNDGKAIFDKLIAPNDQIFMVLCGHMDGRSPLHTVMKNAAGHDVQVFLQCFHSSHAGGRVFNAEAPAGGWPSGFRGPDDVERNGAGWLTVLVFDPGAGTITHYTYSPVVGIWANNRPRENHKVPDGKDGVWWNRTFPEGNDVFKVVPFDIKGRGGR